MNERRIARIQRQIKERIATALVHEISDPRVGFVTISRVEMDKEMQQCKVFWTMLGDAKAQRLTASALDRAAVFLRREVAHPVGADADVPVRRKRRGRRAHA